MKAAIGALAVVAFLATVGCTVKFEASVLKQLDRPGEVKQQ